MSPKSPRLALLVALALPLTALVVAMMRTLGVPIYGGAAGVWGWFVPAMLSLLMSIPLAARLRRTWLAVLGIAALQIAGGFAFFLWLSIPIYPEDHRDLAWQHAFGMMQPTFWLSVLIGGLVWHGRQAYDRPWDWSRVPEWVGDGFRELPAKDSFAVVRIAVGLLCILGPLVGVLALGPPSGSQWTGWLRGMALLGMGLFASGLSLRD